MSSYIEICWWPTFAWNGQTWTLYRRCRRFPLYVEIVEPPTPIPPIEFEREFVSQFEGATVGPGLRDLGRTIQILRIVDQLEDDRVRAQLQELLAQTVRERAEDVLPGAEVEISFDRPREELRTVD